MKKVLCINYSQSGQLHKIVNNVSSTLEDVKIDRVHVKALKPYLFPWTAPTFYRMMPEVVLEEPIELKELSLKEENYDLIILGYQPWFLSPSLPTTSLLKSDSFKRILKDTPVITVIGSRTMWQNSQRVVVRLLEGAKAKLVGNIAFVDRAPNQISAMTIVHWMMTGKKTRKWGFMPLPGVSEDDINEASKFGSTINNSLKKNDFTDLQDNLIQQGAVKIKTTILFVENRAKKIFKIWANLIKKKESQGKDRTFWIKFFQVYLHVALYVVAPVLVFIYLAFFLIFDGKSIAKQKKALQYLGIKSF